MEDKKLRIYWRKLDENGNEIERGVDDREYVYLGNAQNRAYKLFGTYAEHKGRIQWHAGYRDPWAKYYRDVQCNACGGVFSAEESPYSEGYTIDVDRIYLHFHSDHMKDIVDGNRPGYNGDICVNCGCG